MEEMTTREALEYAWDKSVAEQENMEGQASSTGTISVPQHKPRYAELNFDGQKLDWVENDQVTKSWPAMSGDKDYQSRDYTGLKNKGPIPEGSWYLRQQNLQNFDDLPTIDKAISYVGSVTKLAGKPLGKWPGVNIAWGNHRIPLEAGEETNTMGRTNIFLHGGNRLGSAGCIDLAGNMDKFTEDYRDYGRDMRLNVRYPNRR